MSQDDADAIIAITKELNESAGDAKLEQIDEDLLTKVAYQASGDLAPMTAVIGGITAQEVMKACSGKFSPIKQWLYYDALECLPEDETDLTEESCKPVCGLTLLFDSGMMIFR